MMRINLLVAALAAVGMASVGTVANATPTVAKNVIVMISDGASWGTWDAGNYYTYGSNAASPYANFGVKLGMTTTPMNLSNTPTMDLTQKVTYDPAQAWNSAPGATTGFAGYDYIAKNSTDSAAAGTAIASGQKSFNNAINWSNMNEALPYITQTASAAGKATGVVSSVPFSHATPAAFTSQNVSRNNYAAISSQMINNPSVNLIMGTGNPDYSANGASQTANYKYIGATEWSNLKAGATGYQLIQSKSDFEALAAGTLVLEPGKKVFGAAQNQETLQQGRTAGAAALSNVPSLATMTRGALNALSKDPDGMFVMVEGGAVDWAAHANQKDRIIEEQHDFNKSVEAVINWVNTKSNWNETLLIVTTDHGNASPMGLDSATTFYQGVQNNGQGNMPGFRFWGSGHKNEVVPLFAMGVGANNLIGMVDGVDTGFNQYVNTDGRFGNGSFIANTDLYSAMGAALAPVPEPETYAMLLAGLGLMGAVARRRKAK